MPRQPNDSLTETLNHIQQGIGDMIVKVPEADFVNLFLPLLMGKGPKTPEGGLDISPWINLVGGLHREAHVVDVQGNILWTIPALFPTATLNTSEKQSFLNTITEAKQTSVTNPNAFNIAAHKAYNNGSVIVGKDTVEKRNTWNRILAHYGYPITIDQPTDTSPVGTNNDIDYFFNFD